MVDAQDLKSCGMNIPCGFDSHPRHMAGRREYKKFITEIQVLTQEQLGIRPASDQVKEHVSKRGNTFQIREDAPQWMKESIAGPSKALQN